MPTPNYDDWKLDDGFQEDTRRVIGRCHFCGCDLHEENENFYGDDFARVSEGWLVCEDCSHDYWKYCKEEYE